MDKAGSYGLQGKQALRWCSFVFRLSIDIHGMAPLSSGLARCWVREVHGCLNNVIGFPVQRVAEEIQLLAAKKQL